MSDLPKRANTNKEKEFIVMAILEFWKLMPELRLGQLLENAKPRDYKDLFYIEDWDLLTEITKFEMKYNKKK